MGGRGVGGVSTSMIFAHGLSSAMRKYCSVCTASQYPP